MVITVFECDSNHSQFSFYLLGCTLFFSGLHALLFKHERRWWWQNITHWYCSSYCVTVVTMKRISYIIWWKISVGYSLSLSSSFIQKIVHICGIVSRVFECSVSAFGQKWDNTLSGSPYGVTVSLHISVCVCVYVHSLQM